MNTLSKILIGSTISIAALSTGVPASDLTCKVKGADDVVMNNITILRSNESIVKIDGSYKSPVMSNIYRIDAVDGKDISATPTYLYYNHYPLADHQLLATVQVDGQEAFKGLCTVSEEM